ncbi:replication-relaxation family protein [Streptomyces sp. NBC_01373]|uniref:replication-relaxation family protein n=1 Tax=Streptomyces sp. NBC_01373 TaxID=2903843 RepID=UPI00224F2112|nr:replication-relaxation family protein [Streptomyces sp. NBC_01373]MCX4699008.1 replication-relaxation family protein [Streptomyces sp. NBC_01373]
MELRERDFEVIRLVGTFTQLASTHISELLFADRSHTVPDKVLGRLTQNGYLVRVGRRISGVKGGAGAYVFKLGRYGRALLDVENRQSTTVNNHALMVADVYLELRRAEKLGVLRLTDWAAETAVSPSVRADLAATVEFPQQARSSRYFLEIDLGTERPTRITEKVAGYWRAVETSTADYFPFVVFVVWEQARKNELARVFGRLPVERQEMVRVYVFGELIPELMRL